MRIVLAIALVVGVTATAATASLGIARSASAAWIGSAATAIGSGAHGRVLGDTTEVGARSCKEAHKRSGTKAGGRRRASASRGRAISAERRNVPTRKRSHGASTHHELPPNLGIGVGIGL